MEDENLSNMVPIEMIHIPEHVKKTLRDERFTRFVEYIQGSWTSSSVAMHIREVTSNPMICPPPVQWKIPGNQELSNYVWAVLVREDILIGLWPRLLYTMGDNIDNLSWTAAIATTITFFNILQVLPMLTAEDSKG